MLNIMIDKKSKNRRLPIKFSNDQKFNNANTTIPLVFLG